MDLSPVPTVCVHGFGQVGESVLVSSCVNQVKALLSGDGLGKSRHRCKGNLSHVLWVAPFPLPKALLDHQDRGSSEDIIHTCLQTPGLPWHLPLEMPHCLHPPQGEIYSHTPSESSFFFLLNSRYM